MKKTKFFKLAVFVFAFIVGMCNISAEFANSLTLTTVPEGSSEVFSSEDTNHTTGTKWKKLGDNLAFCGSGFGILATNGANYTLNNSLTAEKKLQISKIFAEGNAKSISFNGDATSLLNYFKIQSAIQQLLGRSGTVTDIYSGSGKGGTELLQRANSRSGNVITDVKTNTVSISPATLQLTYDSTSQKYQGTYTLSGVRADNNVSCSVTGITGAEVSGPTNNKVIVKVPKSSLTSSTTTGTLTCEHAREYYYDVAGYTCNTVNGVNCNGQQELFIYEEKYGEKKLTATFTITKKPSVTISKTDATGQKELPGAKLSILGKDEKVLNNCVFDKTNHKITYSTGSDATACTWTSEDTPYTIEGLPIGKYYLIEEIAPEGYEKSSEKILIEITESGAVKDKVVMKNSPKKVPVPDTLSTRSAVLLTLAMFDVALGIGILLYLKKFKTEK